MSGLSSALFLAATAADHRAQTAPDRASPSAPSHDVTPAPDPAFALHRPPGARQQSDPTSSDGRTGFIAWYSQSDRWVSATCPSHDYFAADDKFGVCCPRDSPYCDVATSCGGASANYAVGPSGQADCGPRNTCDTITMLPTHGSTDARRIIFCIAVSEAYVLPKTWYRVTSPLSTAESTATVTVSAIVTTAVQTGGHTGGQPAGPLRSPPARATLVIVAIFLFFRMMAF
ncbi:hypothetical protein CH35J_012490 [Colletotrichum higginsianum]|nr:hypothetical protein CH35J_012490 [Colletotrichum higginsianum]